jgi:AcrR family transcriptional regulator
MPYPAKTSADSILEAALEILEHEGEAALSMRTLAERSGIKAPSLYRHYPSKEALEGAMVRHGNTLLKGWLGQAARDKAPLEAVRAAAQAYLDFTRAHPHLYRLMSNVRLGALAGNTGKDLWNTVLGLVGRVTGNPDDTASAVALWAFLYGFAELERSGLFGSSGPQGGFEVGLEALLSDFQARRQSL